MSPDADSETDALLGRTLDDRYRIEERIGRGGMGAVYRGRHLMMDQPVAVKVLRPDLAHDASAAKRFAREARGSFRLDDPHCVRISDFGYDTSTGLLYLVMELLDGRTVGDELEFDGPLSGRRATHIAVQVCQALEHAHGLGLVHRDLKPDNIMLMNRGDDADYVKVLDFGLAKLYEPDSAGTTMFSRGDITQQGTVFGTPEYMSPEQATGQDLDPRSDIYALGIVMYQMLTGVLPFEASTFMAVLSKQVRDTAVAPIVRRPELGIAPALSALVMRCIAKKADSRPARGAALITELEATSRELDAVPSRLPKGIASSPTMDLSRSQVHGLEARVAAVQAAASPTSDFEPFPPPGAGRRWWLLLMPLVAVLASVAVVVATTGDSTSGAAATKADAGSSVGVPPPARVEAGAAAVAPVDAGGPADATRRTSTDPGAAKRAARRRRARIDTHMKAARAAQSAGNTLKQIAEADAALRLDHGNRKAAYLLGDALVRSGDKARGCRYLHRARKLKQARERHRRAKCDTSPGD